MNLFELWGTICIDAQTAVDTISSTMVQVGQLKGQLEGTEQQSNKTGEAFGKNSKIGSGAVWLGNALSTVTNKVGQWAINGAKAASKLGIGFNANIEAYERQFEALLQNEEAAKGLVAQIQALAKETPLGMEGLANNAVSLLNAGIELEQIIPTLEMLGNLALGDQEKMNGITRAYQQILGKGMLMAQEMYQLSDQGVPIIEIMTKYGGERYDDGSWYAEKMTNPKYQIPAEDMMEAFKAATAEGAKWEGYMFKMMDTYSGQMDRFGESGKETMGNLTESFFNLLSSDIMPRLTNSLENFNTWVTENKESIKAFSKAVADFVVVGFDKSLTFFQWMVDNGGTVKAILWGVAAAFLATVAAAHPYIAALATIIGYIETVKGLQKDIDKFENKYELPEPTVGNALRNQKNNKKSGLDLLEGLYLGNRSVEINAELKEGAENDLQNDLDAQDLSVDVKVNPIMSWLGNIFGGKQSFTHTSNSGKTHGIGSGDNFGADGSHASGLERVPFDGYRAILHRDEAVLTASEAKAWRGEQKQNGQLASMVAAAVRDAVAGIQFNVSLDSGALVGQLAPRMDMQLGTLASRKGRG